MVDKLLYSTAEAAEALGVSSRTIARWVKDGRIKAVRAGGRLWRISAEEIRRVTEEGTTVP
jgi:excisionase family DNA binding protein